MPWLKFLVCDGTGVIARAVASMLPTLQNDLTT